MIKIAVIIPYFQRQPGILRRALSSILIQEVLPGTNVEIIVVDDGSPVTAESEIEGLDFAAPFHLRLIKQPNGGVAMARNTALKAIDNTTKYIAFLDSDDSWRQGHLEKALRALEQGADFYFCDNKRADHHSSHFARHRLIKLYIERHSSARNGDIVDITTDELCTTILREFITQASTVIYKRDIYPDLLFDTDFIQAGEDIIFFLQLSTRAVNAKFSTSIMVDCGKGINLYFGSLGWDNPAHLAQVITNLKARDTIRTRIPLSRENLRWIKNHIKMLGRNIAFLALRQFIKTKGKIPEEIRKLAHEDKAFYHWFPLSVVQVVIGKPLGIYKPD